MNKTDEKRSAGSHMNDDQIHLIQRCPDMSARDILAAFPKIYEGITESNIHDHRKIWSRYPEDDIEAHKRHYKESKAGKRCLEGWKPETSSAELETLRNYIRAYLDYICQSIGIKTLDESIDGSSNQL